MISSTFSNNMSPFCPEHLRGPHADGFEFFDDGVKVVAAACKVHGGPNLGAFRRTDDLVAKPWENPLNLGGSLTEIIHL